MQNGIQHYAMPLGAITAEHYYDTFDTNVKLERHLRVKLLVSVTAEGASYYEKTTRLLKELDDVDTSFSEAQSRPRGHLRIDMGSSAANLLIIPALPEFFARYPDIRIDVNVSDRHVDLIGDNVDCAIRGGIRRWRSPR